MQSTTTQGRRHRLATVALLALATGALAAASSAGAAVAASCARGASVDIVRDDWGIAHVHGHTDADAVFGMIYAEAEDDFGRIESNYLTALGRLAEADGERAIYQDLRNRLYVSPGQLRADYARSPRWLQTLMVAWADGLNCFLAGHAGVRPRVLSHFEPWMALSFSEGSIGGDIERITLGPLAAFYDAAHAPRTVADLGPRPPREPGGSNGIAIAPSNARDHHALLLINPHTSFYFRSELQVSSDAGLNAYGAATWGQFFLYQGFNERLGWMHTSSGVDNVDFFAESVVRRGGKLFYRYGGRLRRVGVVPVTIRYRLPDGGLGERRFATYRTHHGPVVRAEADGRWTSIALMHRPVEALTQSYSLTRARDYAAFMRVMRLKANSTNNTVYADADGNIAYLHPQFVPRRDDRFDYTHPVDGADPATDWKGLHELDELPRLLNPASGWIANTNNWPYSAAGASSPRREGFPRYMDTAGENPRGVHATQLLTARTGLTADELNALAYDPYLPAFATLIPSLLAAYDGLPEASAYRAQLADPIDILRAWDDRWSTESVPTALAALWGDEIWGVAKQDADEEGLTVYEAIVRATTAEQKLAALAAVTERLSRDFGTWRVAWGEINRFQRLDDAIVPTFSDAQPSVPIGFTSSRWGSLASFGARRYEGTSRYYGTSGNSFVAIVEFGARVRARAVMVGGESGDPHSKHFADQVARYAEGRLREVYFYPDQLVGHVERTYHPG